MKGVRVSRSKYHRCFSVDDLHHHRPDGVDKEVVSIHSGDPARCHLEQQGAVPGDELEHLGK